MTEANPKKSIKMEASKSRLKKQWCQKKSTFFGKLGRKKNYSGDDFQGEKIVSTPLKRQVAYVVSPHEITAISS